MTPTRAPRARWRWPPGGCCAAATAGAPMSGCDSDGKPRFIEVNPLAGIRPGYSDLCFIADFEDLTIRT